jgi:uncharacterized protein
MRSWLAGDFELVVSDLLLAELTEALAARKLRSRIPAEAVEVLLSRLAESALRVADPQEPLRRSADPDDDYLIALAETAPAVLVSGDGHVLALAASLPIRTPADFLAQLSD